MSADPPSTRTQQVASLEPPARTFGQSPASGEQRVRGCWRASARIGSPIPVRGSGERADTAALPGTGPFHSR